MPSPVAMVISLSSALARSTSTVPRTISLQHTEHPGLFIGGQRQATMSVKSTAASCIFPASCSLSLFTGSYISCRMRRLSKIGFILFLILVPGQSRSINSSITCGKGFPVPAHIFGKPEASVRPGIVFISLTSKAPLSLRKKKSTRARPEPSMHECVSQPSGGSYRCCRFCL